MNVNLNIRRVLKPVKNWFIPLPNFEAEDFPKTISFAEEEQNYEKEEYVFHWQEKVFNKSEFVKFKDSDKKGELDVKYCHSNLKGDFSQKKLPEKLFSFVDVDNFSIDENVFCMPFNTKKTLKIDFKNSNKKLEKIPKSKIISYPNFKNKLNSTKSPSQKMFIMIDLNSNNGDDENNENNYEVLCMLNYNDSNNLLEMTPQFSKSESKPYLLETGNGDNKKSFYYWLFHASNDITNEMKKLHIGSDFFSGDSNNLYTTVLGDIISAKNFEYSNLYIKYFVKMPPEWEIFNSDDLFGITHISKQNSRGTAYFSHLFEFNLYANLQLFKVSLPEIIFEVLSIDNYNRYRHEGYTYVSLPHSPGMYEFNLKCWRAADKKIRSKLERFFIGGGSELEDIFYVGLSNYPKAELVSRFGFETIPSGEINLKLSILHQSEFLKKNEIDPEFTIGNNNKKNKDFILSSLNSVLEAFRKARSRMLEAKKDLESQFSNINLDVRTL
ncbi:hypothetical protein Phum_PHUM105540 [Pediculus humanus corporis]|uniref:Meckel syndrome type 1 protein n=1 Tax=Pediculus humanus subsp. corporis TaxID=121224 RepID=E0VD41_PEDHC|nr:uncharacterized protein Phum_PHUM105540 [Pediculus humanus corporis]EEB11297.1 hypothetical protein Phum_PHUM105540 [Pediculus humanus corporis]